jgi:hypothetical protein
MPDAVPIFTKRDPVTGLVLFDFTGHIQAQGVDFTEPVVTTTGAATPTDSVVQWLDPAGLQRSAISGRHIQQVLPVAVDLHQLLVQADDRVSIVVPDYLTQNALVDVDGQAGAVYVKGGAERRLAVDQNANSDFVQTTSTKLQAFNSNQAAVNVALGYDTGVTAALASGTDQAITITHNLGVNATQCIALGMLYDGFFSGLASWRGTLGTNNAIFNIGNPSANPNVRAGLRVAFVYW